MSTIFKHRWPLFVAVTTFIVVAVIILLISLRQSVGKFVYAIDDAYIHMAIAKNFVTHGVWGVTPYGFTSSSSSLLWTLLLSLVQVVLGNHELIPLILNLVLALAVIYLVYGILWASHISGMFNAVVLLAIILLTPLPLLVFSEMEHTLQLLIDIGFLYTASVTIALPREQHIPRRTWVLLGVLSSLVTLTRYEGLFMVGVACLLLLFRRGIRHGLLVSMVIGLSAALPVVLYGLISVAHGWYFLPNSVILKGGKFELSSALGVLSLLGLRGIAQLVITRYLLALFVGLIILILWRIRRGDLWKMPTIASVIVLLTLFLHIQFAQIGSFYRYEAYLIALTILVIALSIKDYLQPASPRRYLAAALFALVIAIFPAQRAIVALTELPHAMTNTHEQQYQMASFIREFYQGQGVAANDIGAVNHLAEVKLLDVAGLGNLDVARIMMSQNRTLPNSKQIDSLARALQVRMAVFSNGWVDVPPGWIRVGEWTITNNVIAASETIVFYALNEADADTLRDNLRMFIPRLPKNVITK